MSKETEDEQLERMLDDMETSRQEDAMEAAEAYLRRGRLFSGLSDDDLLKKWTEVREAHTENPLVQDLAQLESDITVECSFRRIKPPYSEENLKQFMANLRKAVK
jgi:hypothetical protein